MNVISNVFTIRSFTKSASGFVSSAMRDGESERRAEDAARLTPDESVLAGTTCGAGQTTLRRRSHCKGGVHGSWTENRDDGVAAGPNNGYKSPRPEARRVIPAAAPASSGVRFTPHRLSRWRCGLRSRRMSTVPPPPGSVDLSSKE